ncbi:inner membrane transporter RhtA [Luteococcus japonicus]|uniref:Inner membrane transporter RhtA n=1 Tax=Luteococcus japonicus TaxID=33984 RepID=A0A3N1ZVI1_9ACTN|nr:EamA family transporter [Luteococcus japonicus]ROR54861.1 inner membrane transporter RhtA [Luteococcus japonicus]
MTHPASTTQRAQANRTLWLVLAAIASVQFGAAIAKTVFGQVTPTSMTWLRLASASAALLVIWSIRRARRTPAARTPAARTPAASTPTASTPTNRTPRSWPDGIAYALCLVGMNWCIYEAFYRLPLGIAVTLEFLGPLTVSVVGSRRARDVVWALLALAGVALLGVTPTSLDPVGVAFALAAGACWGGYIVTTARAGRSWPGLDALTFACTFGAVVLAVPGILQGGATLWRLDVLLAGAGVGLLSSVIPYSLEMRALKSIPPRVFGILMSAEPAVAALMAFLVLREALSATDLLAMGCVIAATIGATRSA